MDAGGVQAVLCVYTNRHATRYLRNVYHADRLFALASSPRWAANEEQYTEGSASKQVICIDLIGLLAHGSDGEGRDKTCGPHRAAILFSRMSQTDRLMLAIENSNPSAVDATGTDGRGCTGVVVARVTRGSTHMDPSLAVLACEPIRQLGREADDLMPAVARAVERAGLRPSDIQQVAVSVGPGGYTAVRMACAAGKMLAHAVGATCTPVPSAWVVAASAFPGMAGVRFAVALAGKDESAHFTVFDAPQSVADLKNVATDAGILRAGDVCSSGVRVVYADRFLPESIRVALRQAGAEVVHPQFDPVACATVAMYLPTIQPEELVPIYPREPDAVTLWRARQLPSTG